jgi:hypothetical protein
MVRSTEVTEGTLGEETAGKRGSRTLAGIKETQKTGRKAGTEDWNGGSGNQMPRGMLRRPVRGTQGSIRERGRGVRYGDGRVC